MNNEQTRLQNNPAGSALLKPGESVYQFRIDLMDISPPVWRRILIPATFSFQDLHRAIQNVMGWEDYHLHEFGVIDPSFGEPVTMENSDEESQIIGEWFTLESPLGSYTYDFGDSWEHRIKLEKITGLEKDAEYPQCVKGKRACPPEDCGGVWGYEEMLEILNDPEHEDYEETVEWMGEDFKPEHFDPEEVVFTRS